MRLVDRLDMRQRAERQTKADRRIARHQKSLRRRVCQSSLIQLPLACAPQRRTGKT